MIRNTHSRPALFPLFPVIIALLFHACAPEAPNVDLSATGGTVPGSSPGTEYLQVESIYPDAPLPAPDRFPVDTDVVIMFSKPVNMADITAGNIVIPGAPAFGVPTSFSGGKGVRIPFAGNFAYNSTYAITIDPTAIRDSGGDLGVVGPNDAAEFTTSTDTIADYDPVVIAASRYPIDPGPFSRGVGYVVVSFNKAVTSVTAATFTIAPAAASGVPFFSPDEKTWYLPLNTLTYAQVYTVDLDDTVGPGGIEDLGGRDLVVSADNTWTFTVEADPNTAGATTITSVWFTNVTENSLTINWATNKPVGGSSVEWGTTVAYGSVGNEAATPLKTVHSMNIAGLNNATKYYFRVTSDVATSATYYITANNPNPLITDDEVVSDTAPSSKTSLVVLQNNTRLVPAGDSFAVWKDPNDSNIYGMYFNAAGTISWSADGDPIDSAMNNRTNPRIFSDYLGRAIITLEGAPVIYAKRIYNNAGSAGFDPVWGSTPGSGSAADDGLTVGNGTNPSAILIWGAQGNNNVYAGFVTRMYPNAGTAPGSATMFIPANAFYDFDEDLSVAGVVTGYYVYDRTATNSITTVNKAGQNFRHVLGQAAGLIASGDGYVIINSATNYPFTTANHLMDGGTSHTNALNRVFTPHLAAAPGAAYSIDALLVSGGSYARTTGGTMYTNTLAASGTADYSGFLVDTGAAFGAVGVGDVVVNTDDSTYAYVDNVYADELDLSADIFLTMAENYEVYYLLESGSVTTVLAGVLVDSAATFRANGIVTGDYVVNLNTFTNTTVSADPVLETVLSLNLDIFPTLGHNYIVLENPMIAAGTASRANLLIDNTAPFAGVNAGDLAANVTDTTRATVSAVLSNRILQFGSNLFPAGTEDYDIFSDWCTTHPPPPDNPFYQYLLDWNIGIGSGVAVTMYPDVTLSGATPYTADAPPANPLYDNVATYVTNGVAVNDVVVNLTTYGVAPNLALVSTVGARPAGYGERALAMSAGVISNLDTYWILRFADPAETVSVIESGHATSVVAGELRSTVANFWDQGVEPGDIVYNISDNRYASVAVVNSATQLTLNRDIFDTVDDRFIIFASTDRVIELGVTTSDGVVNTLNDTNASFTSANYPVREGDMVRNITTSQDAYVVTVNSATQLTLNTDLITAAGQLYVVLQPRMLFAYERGGDIYGVVIRLRDGSVFRSEFTISGAAGTQANVRLLNRGYLGAAFNGGAFAVYQSGAGPTYTYYGKRIDGNGVLNAADDAANGGLGVQLTPAASTLIDTVSDNYGDFYVLYKNGTTLYLRRISSVMGIDWTSSIANVDDAAMCLSTTGNYPTVVYSRGSEIFIQKFDSADGDNTPGYGETPIVSVLTYAYQAGLSITPDNAAGAIVSWFDERFYGPYIGYVLMAQAVDGAGVRLWDADGVVGVPFDYDGVTIGIPGTWTSSELTLKTLNYNDGGAPWGGLFLWYDYRNGRADIYSDTQANP